MSKEQEVTEAKKDPREYIQAGRRLAMKKSEWLDEWWVGTSPRNGDGALVEGSWAEWVELSQLIIKANAEYQLADTTLDGETTKPDEGVIVATAGEFAAVWNSFSPERREQVVKRLMESQEAAARCFQHDHDHLEETYHKISDTDLNRLAQYFYEATTERMPDIHIAIMMTGKPELVAVLEQALSRIGIIKATPLEPSEHMATVRRA